MKDGGSSHFYKYRSLEGDAKERTRRTITDNAIWFSRPETFNDLFDCAPDFSMAAPAPAFRRYVMQLFRDKGPSMNRSTLRAQIADIRRDPARQQNSPVFRETMRRQTWKTVNEAGVLSLSTRQDQVLMWSHYAASHTGVCLRFSGASWAFPFRAAQPVIYSATRPVLNPVFDDGEAIMSKVVLTKAAFWAYEEEWRVISHPGSPVRPAAGTGSSPTSRAPSTASFSAPGSATPTQPRWQAGCRGASSLWSCSALSLTRTSSGSTSFPTRGG